MKFKNWMKLCALIYTLMVAVGGAVDADNLTAMALTGVTFAILAVAEELNHE